MGETTSTGRQCGSRRRGWQWWRVLVAVVSPYLLIVGCVVNCYVLNPEVTDPVEAAEIILDGIQRYYREQGEYPPFLLGGGQIVDQAAFFPVLDQNILQGGWHPVVRDPLVDRVQSFRYPVYKRSFFHARCLKCAEPKYWWCAVSTPGTYLCVDKDGRNYSVSDIQRLAQAYQKGRIDHELWKVDETYSPEEIEQMTQADLAEFLLGHSLPDNAPARLAALGGRSHVETRQTHTAQVDGSYKSEEIEETILEYTIYPKPFYSYFRNSMPFFGYQRGEAFGKHHSDAWFWIYNPAFNVGQTPELSGLDLLNASTGELIPDGIPDGIMLLYKLCDGKVVEVVEAAGEPPATLP